MEQNNISPKAKAKELFDKFWMFADEGGSLIKNNTKACALICIDEITQINKSISSGHGNLINTNSYWNEVKQEIEKL